MLVDDGLIVRHNGTWEAAAELASSRCRRRSTRSSPRVSTSWRRRARGRRARRGRRAASSRGAPCASSAARSGQRPERQPPLARPQGAHRPGGAARAAPSDAFRFAHILVRDAAYAGLAKRRRAELHERFARLARASPERAAGEYEEILGYHLEQAAGFAARARRCGRGRAHRPARRPPTSPPPVAERSRPATSRRPATCSAEQRATCRKAIRSAWRCASRRRRR